MFILTHLDAELILANPFTHHQKVSERYQSGNMGKKKHESSTSTSSVQRGDSEGGDRCHQLEINMVEPDGVGRGGLVRRTAAFIAVG